MVSKLVKLIEHKQKKGSVVGFPGSKKVSTEELLTTKCDILVPGALENQITAKIAKKLKCKIIAEAANGPTLPEADPIIYKKKIIVIPDIWQTLVVYVFHTWSGYKTIWDSIGAFDEVANKMEIKHHKGFKDSYALSKKHKIDMRRAAMALAVERVVEAFNTKASGHNQDKIRNKPIVQ